MVLEIDVILPVIVEIMIVAGLSSSPMTTLEETSTVMGGRCMFDPAKELGGEGSGVGKPWLKTLAIISLSRNEVVNEIVNDRE